MNPNLSLPPVLEEYANYLPIKAELHNWQVQHFHGKDYIAVWGYVYNDDTGRFRDGEWIRTSMIAKIEDGIAVTLNSAYRLVGTEAKVYAHVN